MSGVRGPGIGTAGAAGGDAMLAAVARAAEAITAARTVHEALEAAGARVRELAGAGRAHVRLDTGESAGGVPAGGAGGEDDPLADPVLDRLLTEHRGRVCLTADEVRADPRLPDAGPLADGLLAVSLVGRSGRPMGRIVLAAPVRDGFGESERNVVGPLAHLAAAVVERLLLDRDLRAETDRMRAMFAAMRDGVVATDLDRRILDVSPSFCALTGYSADELIGLPPPHPYWPPEDVATIVARLDENRRGGGVGEIDGVLQRKDGSRAPVIATVSPIHDRDRRLVGYLTTLKDVSERQAAQEALERSRADLARAQEIAKLGSWALDAATGRLELSDQAVRIYGVPPEETPSLEQLMGMTHPGDRAATERAVRAAVAGAAPLRVEHRVLRPDGTTRTIRVTAEFERDERGAVRGLGTVLDVTDLRRAEEQAQQQAATVRRLAEARGRLVVDALEAEDRARQRIAEILHDDVLQEILAARQDVAEAMAKSEPNPALTRAAEGIARSAARLREAVSDLHPVTLSHAGLGPALEAISQRAARQGGIDVELDLDDGPVAHERLVLGLVRELLVNVVKHARASHAWVRVAHEGPVVVVSVRDDGAGTPAARLAQAPREGHVGLASLRERVAAVGGQLTIESAPEAGTTAVARLPRTGGDPPGRAPGTPPTG